MPTNLKYAPGITRACKSCGQPFIVPINRQITGDFCSPHCGIWWGLSRSPKWAKRRDTTRPTAAALLKADLTSLSGGQDSPSLAASFDMLSEGAPPEAPLSQPALDRT